MTKDTVPMPPTVAESIGPAVLAALKAAGRPLTAGELWEALGPGRPSKPTVARAAWLLAATGEAATHRVSRRRHPAMGGGWYEAAGFGA
jgi:hypothetical protein